MFKFIISLLSLLIGYISSTNYPFDIENCNKCLSDINTLRKSNNIIKNIYSNLSICNKYSNKECELILNESEYWLQKKNSTDVCRQLKLCDTLDYNNYLFFIQTDNYGNNYNYLYRYYNRILVTNNTINTDADNIINTFNTLYEISLTEPYQKIEIIYVPTMYKITYILKLYFENYLYYYYHTNYILIAKFYTGKRYYNNVNNQITSSNNSNPNILFKKNWSDEKKRNQYYAIDTFNNGSLYGIVYNYYSNNTILSVKSIKFIF